MHNQFNDPIGVKIFDSFGPSHNEWRSLGGIERQSGLTYGQVASYIDQHSNLFEQAPISPGGMNLYKPNLGRTNW